MNIKNIWYHIKKEYSLKMLWYQKIILNKNWSAIFFFIMFIIGNMILWKMLFTNFLIRSLFYWPGYIIVVYKFPDFYEESIRKHEPK